MVPPLSATVISGETHRKLNGVVCAAAGATLIKMTAASIARMLAANRPRPPRANARCPAFPSEFISCLIEPQQTVPLQRLLPSDFPEKKLAVFFSTLFE